MYVYLLVLLIKQTLHKYVLINEGYIGNEVSIEVKKWRRKNEEKKCV